MKTATALLLTLTTIGSLAAAAEEPISPSPSADADGLTAAFFTTRFLAEVTARIQKERTEQERLTGGYLQEKTGLIWARSDNGTDVDWYAADDYCRDLEIADWFDWRMPTIDELESLHDRRSISTYKLTPDIRLTGCCPWSDTRSGDSSAWNFSFRYRKRFSGSLNYSYALRALCVRAATEADIFFFEKAAEEAEEES